MRPPSSINDSHMEIGGTSRSCASARSTGASHLLQVRSAWAFEQGWGSRWPQDTLGLPTED